MKYLIASDIHGSEYYCKKMLDAFNKEGADRLLLLGDLLYHGPRNELPRDYNTKSVTKMLNAYKDKIIAVRGNCDAEVDQMVLEFPMMADYAVVNDGVINIFATHGHIYNKEKLPAWNFDIMLYGHTHLWLIEQTERGLICNTGSVTFPKEGNPPTFAVYENDCLTVYELSGKVVKTISF